VHAHELGYDLQIVSGNELLAFGNDRQGARAKLL
jgi:hypothetical protein